MSMLVRPVPVHSIAACFTLAAFSVSMFAGMIAGNDSADVISRALFIMVICWIVGLIVARCAAVAVEEYVDMYRASRPVPDSEISVAELRAVRDGSGHDTEEDDGGADASAEE